MSLPRFLYLKKIQDEERAPFWALRSWISKAEKFENCLQTNRFIAFIDDLNNEKSQG